MYEFRYPWEQITILRSIRTVETYVERMVAREIYKTMLVVENRQVYFKIINKYR